MTGPAGHRGHGTTGGTSPADGCAHRTRGLCEVHAASGCSTNRRRRAAHISPLVAHSNTLEHPPARLILLPVGQVLRQSPGPANASTGTRRPLRNAIVHVWQASGKTSESSATGASRRRGKLRGLHHPWVVSLAIHHGFNHLSPAIGGNAAERNHHGNCARRTAMTGRRRPIGRDSDEHDRTRGAAASGSQAVTCSA